MKTDAKTVASVSFLDNRSISMDVEEVIQIEMGAPMEVEPGNWFCEMLVRTANGTLAIQLLGDDPERFRIRGTGADLFEG